MRKFSSSPHRLARFSPSDMGYLPKFRGASAGDLAGFSDESPRRLAYFTGDRTRVATLGGADGAIWTSTSGQEKKRMATTRLVIGCGYLGQRVARLWREQGDSVFAVTRSADRAFEFQGQGWSPLVADILDSSSISAAIAAIPPPESVLFAVGYDRGAAASIRQVYVEGLRHCCDALLDRVSLLRSFVYISSTGVYGRIDGDWVDESSPCDPTREGGRACLEAEQLLRGGPLGMRTIILRCAGLYGPGRTPMAASIRAGEPIAAPADGYLNLIHIDDAAEIAAWAADNQPPPELFNVADGHPVIRRQYYEELARILNAPPPVFAAPSSDSPAATRAAGGDKRVRCDRLLTRLPGPLRYPSYREGLRVS